MSSHRVGREKHDLRTEAIFITLCMAGFLTLAGCAAYFLIASAF